MVTCYIGIGSNLGDRRAYIDAAIEELKKLKEIKVKRVSTVYETDSIANQTTGDSKDLKEYVPLFAAFAQLAQTDPLFTMQPPTDVISRIRAEK